MTVQEAMAAIKLNPKSADAWTDLGAALADNGEFDKARDCFNRALKFDPNNARAAYGLVLLDTPPDEPEQVSIPPWLQPPAEQPRQVERPRVLPSADLPPLQRTVAPATRSRTPLILGLLVAVILVLGTAAASAAFYLARNRANPIAQAIAPTCSQQSQEYIVQLQKMFDDWDDAHKLASATSRIALSPAVARLQELRREAADNLKPPVCAGTTKGALLEYMDAVIQAFFAFMADSEDSEVSQLFEVASSAQSRFVREFDGLKNDAYLTPTALPPTPKPTWTPSPTPTPVVLNTLVGPVSVPGPLFVRGDNNAAVWQEPARQHVLCTLNKNEKAQALDYRKDDDGHYFFRVMGQNCGGWVVDSDMTAVDPNGP
jgi:tetratricopeptide (TPR) repeat protein